MAAAWIGFTIVCYAVILTGGLVKDIGRGDMTPTFHHLSQGFGIDPSSHGDDVRRLGVEQPVHDASQVAAVAAPLTALVGLLSAYVITRHRFVGPARVRVPDDGQLRDPRHRDRRLVHRRVQRRAARADRRHGDPRAVLRVPQHAGRRARGRGGARADRPHARRGELDAARVDDAHADEGRAAAAQARDPRDAGVQLHARDDGGVGGHLPRHRQVQPRDRLHHQPRRGRRVPARDRLLVGADPVHARRAARASSCSSARRSSGGARLPSCATGG